MVRPQAGLPSLLLTADCTMVEALADISGQFWPPFVAPGPGGPGAPGDNLLTLSPQYDNYLPHFSADHPVWPA